jgi:hypothetical protein
MSGVASEDKQPRQAFVIALGFGAYNAGSNNDAFHPTKLYWPSHYGMGQPFYVYAPGLPHPLAAGQTP